MTEFEQTGRAWLRGAVRAEGLAAFDALGVEAGGAGRRLETGGVVDWLSDSGVTAGISARWPRMRSVRVVMFDKTPASNWALPWHQDRVIAVGERAEVPGYSNWTTKGGVPHCEPPEAVLRRMLFVRVHLDPSTKESGAMEIAVGSHRRGLVEAGAAAEVAAAHETEATEAAAGDVLVLSMLTLHRSRAATSAATRRVLRVDYADFDLPAPLLWALGT